MEVILDLISLWGTGNLERVHPCEALSRLAGKILPPEILQVVVYGLTDKAVIPPNSPGVIHREDQCVFRVEFQGGKCLRLYVREVAAMQYAAYRATAEPC